MGQGGGVWDRYHLTLALWSLAAGTVAAGFDDLADRWAGGHGAPHGVVPSRLRRVHPLGRHAWPLVLVSLAGVWSAVPDTEAPLAAATALAPIAGVRWWRGRPPTPPATAVLVGVVVVAALAGSAGRPGAVMTWTAVGAVAVAPTVAGFPTRRSVRGAGLVAVASAHVAVAVPGARALMRLDRWPAVALGLLWLLLVAVAVAGALRRTPR